MVNVAFLQPRGGYCVLQPGNHGVYREFINLPAVHVEHRPFRRMPVHGAGVFPSGNSKILIISCGGQLNRQQIAALGKHCRAGAVAKEHTGCPVVPVRAVAHVVSTHDQHLFHPFPGKKAGGYIHAVKKAGAGRVYVKGRTSGAQLFLYHAGLGWTDKLPPDGSADNHIQLLGSSLRVLQSVFRRRYRQIGDGFLGADSSFLNACARADPFVAGLHHGRNFLVGQNVFRNTAPCSDDSKTHLLASIFSILCCKKLFNRPIPFSSTCFSSSEKPSTMLWARLW